MRKFPIQNNDLPPTSGFLVNKLIYSQILDFGRFIIRIDPQAGRGYFEAAKSGSFHGVMHFVENRLAHLHAGEMPPQVRLALERAGYEV